MISAENARKMVNKRKKLTKVIYSSEIKEVEDEIYEAINDGKNCVWICRLDYHLFSDDILAYIRSKGFFINIGRLYGSNDIVGKTYIISW